ncbi:MAG: YggS family pyridoxal phosphate-dependent enzyme [Bacillota bacterium]|nr:YggS family pyridoxal phosphate-dependent enzyme [Bacillota bacterium]
MDSLSRNLLDIKKKIASSASKVGRSSEEITLIAVSKKVDVETAQAAFKLGIQDFGENRVPELNKKNGVIPEARWHMIGRLQTNKVKDVVEQACLIHSLDRWNLAEEISKRAKQFGIEVPVLLEVNVSGEEEKAGVKPNDVKPFLQSIGELPGIRICGFMTMAPLSMEAEQTRPVFKELKQLFENLKTESFMSVELKYLSMGMSQDFEVAIEEGANMVRIGTALFKP